MKANARCFSKLSPCSSPSHINTQIPVQFPAVNIQICYNKRNNSPKILFLRKGLTYKKKKGLSYCSCSLPNVWQSPELYGSFKNNDIVITEIHLYNGLVILDTKGCTIM